MFRYSSQSALKGFLPFLCIFLWLVNYSRGQTKLDTLIDTFNTEKEDFQKSELIEKIGNVRSPRSFEFLLGKLTDSSITLRIASTKALANFGDTSAIGPLENRWDSVVLPDSMDVDFADEVYEKGFIAASLAKLGRREHVDFIFRALNSSDYTVRYNMVYALGLIGGQDIINKLVAIMITDDSEMASYAAANELIRLLKLDVDPKSAPIIKGNKSFLLQKYSP